MMALTTRQRDLLQILLDATTPLGSGDLAAQMNLTPRQVTYDLKGLQKWLVQHEVRLEVTPGVGVRLDRDPSQSESFVHNLIAEAGLRLILSAEQRQQLLSLILLTADEPLITYKLQQMLEVSRTTVLKDLDAIEEWMRRFDHKLARRPNYGIWLELNEHDRRTALGRLLWGETPWGQPLVTISHNTGLEFLLESEAELLPAVSFARQTISSWNIERTMHQVALAEAQLGGRFTDDGVLHLALMLAIQAERVRNGHLVLPAESVFPMALNGPVWPAAQRIARQLNRSSAKPWPEAEIAQIAIYILGTPRHERWPGDLDTDDSFRVLIDDLMEIISQAYQLPSLKHDITLRDGLVTHIIPACMRQMFRLYVPVLDEARLSEQYDQEHQVAHQVVQMIQEKMDIRLPERDIDHIGLLLRAAYIREQPRRTHEVLVVCPSGMATAQLLTARLQARFPRLGRLKVVSLRELNRTTLSAAELIITTVPLPAGMSTQTTVIRVHPLLLPEDVETITEWLAL